MTQSNLFLAAKQCLDAKDPAEKVALTIALYQAWQAGELTPADDRQIQPIGPPGRPERPRLVSPRELPQRGLYTESGRAALIHAIAHIEFNAINLALDDIYRFRSMPETYYSDWLRVALEEAHHFSLLQERLGELGYSYGDFDAHDGLWEMAMMTAHDPLIRMALVPRVLEARGLDVTPRMIKRLKQAGDSRTVAILEIILQEEVGHVEIGSHWFRYCCEQAGLPVAETFLKLLRTYYRGRIKSPFNEAARLAAGFTVAELAQLRALEQVAD
ncbi:MAG: ferritin-like domain-containing protein [Candidatus Competibacteraceae bacterium]